MWRWMTGLFTGRTRELPLSKRDLWQHDHVDMLPTRWTGQSFSTPLEWSTGRLAIDGAARQQMTAFGSDRTG